MTVADPWTGTIRCLVGQRREHLDEDDALSLAKLQVPVCVESVPILTDEVFVGGQKISDGGDVERETTLTSRDNSVYRRLRCIPSTEMQRVTATRGQSYPTSSSG